MQKHDATPPPPPGTPDAPQPGGEPTSHPTSINVADSARSARLLLVDNHTEVLACCHNLVPAEGYTLQAVPANNQVLDLVQHNLYDLLIIGLHTSALNGLVLIEQIRRQTSDVPIIIIAEEAPACTSTMLHHLARAVQLGIQGILYTPLDETSLLTTLEDALHKHRRDTSYRWHEAQQLVQNEKLATAGRLVASLAHEMNNPLQALNNALVLMGKNTRSLSSKKRQLYLQLAQQETENLISIVRRMLEFYRPSIEGMRPLSLNPMIESVLRVVDHQLELNQVRVLRDWCPQLPNVFAIGSRFKQVIHHLITNAVEAMPNGGVLTIRTYSTNGAEYQINAGFEFLPLRSAGHQVKGPSVVIEISDTGHGIAPDDLPKIFEPFYTTRVKAAGLGLAITYSIVEQHRGDLSVSSIEGQGTTVRVRLPPAT